MNLFIVAFFGGTALSLLELMEMCFHNPQDINIFFFGGMTIAGIIGIGGFLIGGNENIRSAFLSGVAAPQVLGGMVKAGTIALPKTIAFIYTTSTSLCCLFSTPIYAQPFDSLIADSTRILITVEGTHEQVKIKDLKTDKEYTATMNQPLEIPFCDSLCITTNNLNKIVKISKDYIVEDKKRLNVVVIQKKKIKGFLQGLFAQQHYGHKKITHKLEVKEILQQETDSIFDTVSAKVIKDN